MAQEFEHGIVEEVEPNKLEWPNQRQGEFGDIVTNICENTDMSFGELKSIVAAHQRDSDARVRAVLERLKNGHYFAEHGVMVIALEYIDAEIAKLPKETT